MKTALRFLTIGAGLALAGTSWGASVTNYFRAAAVTQTMGDGTPVVMWGFAKDSAPGAHDGVVTVPGPRIELPQGNQDLTIELENTLPEPVSIVIPGLAATLGDPQRNADGRARSFTREAAPGGTVTNTWNNVAPGTYLYHSGSHPAVQVQMGLYGALTKLQANNRAYQGVDTHNSEATLLFSEVDPVLHDAVATGNYGPGLAVSSTTGYQPRYFLVNGQSYTNGMQTNWLAHIVAGNIPNNNAEQNVLLRLINASLDSHIPIVNGEYLKLIAEDGQRYPSSPDSYAAQLPALKTLDAFWTVRNAGTFPLYDRRLNLVNNASAPGGMLAYLAVSRTRNGGVINIPLTGQVSSSINVAGLQGVISKVSVRLNNFYHPRPSDVDVVLVGPGTTPIKVMVMSDAGDSVAINPPGTVLPGPVTLTLDDAAPQSLTSEQLVTGTYKPTNLPGAPDTFTGAAAPPQASELAAFNGTAPNGTWRLFVRDNAAGGTYADGTAQAQIGSWNLIITPRPQF